MWGISGMPRNIIWMGSVFSMVLLVSGCSLRAPLTDTVLDRPAIQETVVLAVSAPKNQGETSVALVNEPSSAPASLPIALAGRGRATGECFQLRPGGMDSKKKKASRCEPQSLPFARCRSGINTCRLGHENGPLTWFACEQQNANTSVVPQPGSILILAANNRRKMPTGHVAYVEKAVAQSATLYRLVFSHTNYDRKCSLETNIEATYNSATRTLDIHGGAWQAWGKGLPVAGFILN